MPVLESTADTKYQHSLPTVSFRVISDNKSLLAPAGVHSVSIVVLHFGSADDGLGTKQILWLCVHFGERVGADGVDNDFSDFERPEYYIRYIGQSPLHTTHGSSIHGEL